MSLLGSGPESLAWLGVEYVSQRMWQEGFFEKVNNIILARDEVFVVSLDRKDLSWKSYLEWQCPCPLVTAWSLLLDPSKRMCSYISMIFLTI